MKKLTVIAAIGIAAAAMVSCGSHTPKPSFSNGNDTIKNQVDTLSYALGISQTQGLMDYLVGRMGMDTAYVDEFIKGLNEGVNAGDDKKKAAYMAGLQIGQQISTQMIPGIKYQVFGEDTTQNLNLKNYMAGFIGAIKNNATMSMDSASMKAQELMGEIKAQRLLKEFGPNKVAGEKFLAEKAKEEGVKALPSGVLYKVIKEGTGAIPTAESKIKCHYEGRNLEDSIFDSSYKRNVEFETYCNRVIKGWTEALTHMPVGSIWEIYIPQELAYAEQQRGQFIKPFSMLKFKVELLEIVEEKK